MDIASNIQPLLTIQICLYDTPCCSSIGYNTFKTIEITFCFKKITFRLQLQAVTFNIQGYNWRVILGMW